METLSTIKKISDSPFTLFIQYKHIKKPHRINGNKFEVTLEKMIINLYRYATKRRLNTITMIIYDNRKTEEANVVLKWDNGLITINNTFDYGFKDINVYNFNCK